MKYVITTFYEKNQKGLEIEISVYTSHGMQAAKNLLASLRNDPSIYFVLVVEKESGRVLFHPEVEMIQSGHSEEKEVVNGADSNFYMEVFLSKKNPIENASPWLGGVVTGLYENGRKLVEPCFHAYTAEEEASYRTHMRLMGWSPVFFSHLWEVLSEKKRSPAEKLRVKTAARTALLNFWKEERAGKSPLWKSIQE